MFWARLIILLVALWPLSAVGELAYLADPESDSISVVDLENGSLLKSFAVGDAAQPTSLALSPDGRHAYVGTAYGKLVVVELPAGRIVKRLRIGNGPTYVVADPDGERVYATGLVSCGLSVVSTSTFEIVASIPAPQTYRPWDLIRMPAGGALVARGSDYLSVFDPAKGKLVATPRRNEAWDFAFVDRFVLIPSGRTVRVIDTRLGAERAAIQVPSEPTPLSVPLSQVIGFLHAGFDMIVAIDARPRVVGAYRVDDFQALAVDMASGRLYVATGQCSWPACEGGEIVAIDAVSGEQEESAAIPFSASRLELSPDRSQLFAFHSRREKVSVVQTAPLAFGATVDLKGDASVVDFVPDGSTAYIATGGTVYAVDRQTYAATPLVGGAAPTRLGASADGRFVFVANSAARTLAQVDAGHATVIETFDLSGSPIDVAASPDGRYAYALIGTPAGVDFIDTQSGEIRTLPLSDATVLRSPRRVAVSPDGAKVYVSAWRKSGTTEQGFDDAPPVVMLLDPQQASIVRELPIRDADGPLVVDPRGRYVAKPAHPGIELVDSDLGGSVLLFGDSYESYDSVLAVSDDGDVLYLVFNEPEGHGLRAISATTHAEVGRIQVDYPSQLFDGSADGVLYGWVRGGLVPIDTASGSVGNVIPLPHDAREVVVVDPPRRPLRQLPPDPILPAGMEAQRAYISHFSGTITVIDGTSPPVRHAIVPRLGSLALAPGGRRLLAIAFNDCTPACGSSVLFLDAATLAVEASIALDGLPVHPKFSPDGTQVYLTSADTGELVVIDVASAAVTARIDVNAGSFALDRAGDRLFLVSSSFDGRPSTVRLNARSLTVEDSARIDALLSQKRIGGDGERFYVGPIWSGGVNSIAAVARLDPDTLRLDPAVPVASFVHEIVADGDGHTYFTGGPCLTRTEGDLDGLRVVSRAIEGSVSRLAIGEESSVVYGLDDVSGSLLLLDASTGETLARLPIEDGVASIVVGDPPSAGPRPTRTPLATFTSTPTPTPTPTPTWTAPPIEIEIGSAEGAPGEEVEVQVMLRAGGQEVVGTQNDIVVAAPLAITACRANSDLGEGFGGFRLAAGSVTAIIVGEELRPLADGVVLYRCRILIAADALAGRYVLSGAAAIAGDRTGRKLAAVATDGFVEVQPATAGDGASESEQQTAVLGGNGGCTLQSGDGSASGAEWIVFGLLGWGIVMRRRSARAG